MQLSSEIRLPNDQWYWCMLKATMLAKLRPRRCSYSTHDLSETSLFDRGTNLLLCPMQDVCKLLRKLNTTAPSAHHPQCNGSCGGN